MTLSGIPSWPGDPVDVLIVGGGPAGVSCALELQESKIACLIIERKDALGGQLADIPTAIANLAAGPFENGGALQASLCAAAQKADLKIAFNENIVSCNLKEKSLTSEHHEFRARAIFLATGYRVKQLPASARFEQFQKHIAYRTGRVQEQFVDKEVVVIGGGDSALYEALERARTAKSVTIINRSANFKARPDLLQEADENKRIHRINSAVVEDMSGNGNGCLKQLALRCTADDTTMTIAAEKVVVKIGYAPNTEFVAGQIDMVETGHIRVNPDCSTSVTGVFAGGDIITPGYDRIASAMGTGAVAARSIREYLYKLEKANVK